MTWQQIKDSLRVQLWMLLKGRKYSQQYRATADRRRALRVHDSWETLDEILRTGASVRRWTTTELSTPPETRTAMRGSVSPLWRMRSCRGAMRSCFCILQRYGNSRALWRGVGSCALLKRQGGSSSSRAFKQLLLCTRPTIAPCSIHYSFVH